MLKNKMLPEDGISGLKHHWKTDAVAGFLVFLLALPLSLGIAKASEFPPAMGVLTAMIGGLAVAYFAGSRLTIKGPAAGLITVCAGAVLEMGGGIEGWHMACGVIVVVGVIQVILSALKLASLSDFFPHSAVHGMLAAIGIIIIAKQIPVLFGDDPTLSRGLSPVGLYTHLPDLIANANPEITTLGIISLVLLFGFPALPFKKLKKIPAPLLVLLVTIPLGAYMNFKDTQPEYALVKIGNFWESVGVNADFSLIGTFVFWKYVFMFLFVNSLESLLTVKAIDHLDPFKRPSDYNKDLAALGGGNTLAGLFGGLPMISEVVRSAANINFGALTRWSNFFHGFFLLAAMLFMIPVIEMIPNTALAAMLIYAGYRLAAPKEFINTYKIGAEQLVIFLTTIVVTLAEDLLLGVAAGILVKFIFHLANGASFRSLFKAHYKIEDNGEKIDVKVEEAALFSNLISYKKELDKLPADKNIVIDFSETNLVDHSFMEFIHHFEEEYNQHGGTLEIIGFHEHKTFSSHPMAARKKKKSSASNF